MPSEQEKFRKVAEAIYADKKILINDRGAVQTTHTGGAWVDALVYVTRDDLEKYRDFLDGTE